ncbi:hypothetical protein HED60_15065 [Planctomycetales bacterium ZRK34]|nr:hypothetical protein HED60_15065 [Planctomycetales bacterium ZRK34]
MKEAEPIDLVRLIIATVLMNGLQATDGAVDCTPDELAEDAFRGADALIKKSGVDFTKLPR